MLCSSDDLPRNVDIHHIRVGSSSFGRLGGIRLSNLDSILQTDRPEELSNRRMGEGFREWETTKHVSARFDVVIRAALLFGDTTTATYSACSALFCSAQLFPRAHSEEALSTYP